MKLFFCFIVISYLALGDLAGAAEIHEQHDCQEKLDRHLQKLKIHRLRMTEKLEIEKRASLIEPELAGAQGTKFFVNAQNEIVADLHAKTSSSSMRLLVDSHLIVLGYRIRRNQIFEFNCADILQ